MKNIQSGILIFVWVILLRTLNI